MIDEEFLKGLLGKEDVSVEEKVQQIVSEHEANVRGLLQKRDELLGSEKKLKEQIAAYETGKAEYEKRIGELDEALKKASSEDNRKYYETQIADNKAKYEAEIQKISEDLNFYKGEHLKALRNAAIDEGVKNLNFIPGLKDGFIARVLSMNDFQPQEIDGSMKFLNKEHHTIEEAINSFALTQEGKAYIANPSSGGGARGETGGRFSGNGKTITRSQFDEMQKNDPAGVHKFFKDGGSVVD